MMKALIEISREVEKFIILEEGFNVWVFGMDKINGLN